MIKGVRQKDPQVQKSSANSTTTSHHQRPPTPDGGKTHRGGQVPVSAADANQIHEQVSDWSQNISSGIDVAKEWLGTDDAKDLFGSDDTQEMIEGADMVQSTVDQTGEYAESKIQGKERRKSIGTRAEEGTEKTMDFLEEFSEEKIKEHQETLQELADGPVGDALSAIQDQLDTAATAVAATGEEALLAGAQSIQSAAEQMNGLDKGGPEAQIWDQAVGQQLSDTADQASQLASSMWSFLGTAANDMGKGAMQLGEQVAQNLEPVSGALESANDALEAVGLDLPGAVGAGARVASGLVEAGYHERYRLELFDLQGKCQDKDALKAIHALLDRTKVLESLGKSGKGAAEVAGKASGIPMAGRAATMGADGAGAMIGLEDIGPLPSGIMTQALTTWTDASIAARLYRVAEAMDYNGALEVLPELTSATNALEGGRKAEFDAALSQHGAW